MRQIIQFKKSDKMRLQVVLATVLFAAILGCIEGNPPDDWKPPPGWQPPWRNSQDPPDDWKPPPGWQPPWRNSQGLGNPSNRVGGMDMVVWSVPETETPNNRNLAHGRKRSIPKGPSNLGTKYAARSLREHWSVPEEAQTKNF